MLHIIMHPVTDRSQPGHCCSASTQRDPRHWHGMDNRPASARAGHLSRIQPFHPASPPSFPLRQWQSKTADVTLELRSGSASRTIMLLQVEKGAIVAAGSLVTPGKTVPSGQIWAGSPAKFLRELEEGEADFILQSANNYAALASVHAAENSKTTEEILVRAAMASIETPSPSRPCCRGGCGGLGDHAWSCSMLVPHPT